MLTSRTAQTASAAATATTTKATAPVSATADVEAPRRRRRGLKRLTFQVPKKMPLPLKALWDAAPVEQQATAHRTATGVLATWLGKKRREEIAKELGISAIRLWQI